MKREVILRAAGYALQNNSIDPNTSAYPWHGGAPSKALYTVWNNDPPGTGGDINEGENGYGWPGNSMEHAVTFEKGPTLARFTKVTIETAFDYSQTGPNNWWFPPQNAHGPGCAIILRLRDLVSWQEATDTGLGPDLTPAHNIGDLPGGAGEITTYNSRPSNPGFKNYLLRWEFTAHPEGGPWLLEDINNLAIGVRYKSSNGPNGKAYIPDQGSFFKIRTPYLRVTLEIEDLGGFVSNMRAASSIALRWFRRARNTVTPVTTIRRAPTLFVPMGLSHPRGPDYGGDGWGRRTLERRQVLPMAKTYSPEALAADTECFDLRAYSCLGWAAYRIDAPWNPELTGLALFDKGKGFEHERAQDGWSPRPGDGVLNRVLEDYPNLSFNGLAAQGGDDIAVCLRNYDCHQSGWSTVSSAGDFAATADVTVNMVEEQGYLSSSKLEYGAGGGAGGREQSLGTLNAGRLHARVIVKNTSVPDPDTQNGEMYIRRGTDYWDEDNRTWSVTPVYIAIPSDEPFGEVILDAIPITNAEYHVGVGRFSSNMGPVTLHAAVVDAQWSDTTVAGARTPLITLDAQITRVAETHRMPQVWGRDLWVHERGSAVCEVQPFWRAEDLPTDSVKPLLHAQHDDDGTGTWDALQFVAKTGSDDLIRFERAIDGEATYQLDCPLTGIDLTRLHVLRAWCRWLGSDGWTQFGPYSVEVGYAVFLESDGSLVASASVVGSLSSTKAVPYARDYLGIGCDETRYLDGYVRMWETRRSPLHGLEAVWRI